MSGESGEAEGEQKKGLLRELSLHLLRKFGMSAPVREHIGVAIVQLLQKREITPEVAAVHKLA